MNNSTKFVVPLTVNDAAFLPLTYKKQSLDSTRWWQWHVGVRFWYNKDSTSSTSRGWSRMAKEILEPQLGVLLFQK